MKCQIVFSEKIRTNIQEEYKKKMSSAENFNHSAKR